MDDLKTCSLFCPLQRGRPPVPPLRWPTLSSRLERWSERATAWTLPAAKVSSWMELGRSPVVQTASGDLRPPGACVHTFQPRYPIKNVSLLSCRLVYYLFSWWIKLFHVWFVVRCGVPAAVRNSNLADGYIAMKSFASGDRVHYVCDVGYVQEGGSRYRRCVDGKWTPLHLRCERKRTFFITTFQTTSYFQTNSMTLSELERGSSVTVCFDLFPSVFDVKRMRWKGWPTSLETSENINDVVGNRI